MLYVETRVRTGTAHDANELRVRRKANGGVIVYIGKAPPPEVPNDLYGVNKWVFADAAAMTFGAVVSMARAFYGHATRGKGARCTGSEINDLGDMIQRHFAN